MHLVAPVRGTKYEWNLEKETSNIFWLISYIWDKWGNYLRFVFGQFLQKNLYPVFMHKVHHLSNRLTHINSMYLRINQSIRIYYQIYGNDQHQIGTCHYWISHWTDFLKFTVKLDRLEKPLAHCWSCLTPDETPAAFHLLQKREENSCFTMPAENERLAVITYHKPNCNTVVALWALYAML